QRPRCVERSPGLDAVAAEMHPFEMSAGDAIAHREVRAAAADGEAGQEIGGELIVEPAGEASSVARQGGAADAGFAIELRSAVEAGEPRPPARLGGRGRGYLLEGGMVRRLGLFGWGVLQRLASKRDAVDVDRFAVTPERALIHHDRRERADGAERG